MREKKNILIIIHEEERLVYNAVLKINRDRVIKTLYLGKESKILDENTFKIDVTDKTAVETFVKNHYKGEVIYYLGGISNIEQVEEVPSINDYQLYGTVTLCRLIKALNKTVGRNSIDVIIITNEMFQVTQDEKVKPLYSSMIGFVKSFMQEYPDWNIKAFDISLDKEPELIEKNIIAGLNMSGEWIAVRNGVCYRRQFYPVALKQDNLSGWRENGTYFILGGTGGIGFALAKYLGKTYKANLVLVGRSKETDNIREQVQQIQQLGGSAIYLTGHADSIYEMKNAISMAKQKYGRIDAVIHSAIVLRDTRIVNMEEETLLEVMKPKVEGVCTFYEAFKEENLDFMLFLSSMQAFVGSFGQSSYAGASSFEDTFAQYLNSIASFPVKLVNWGYWGETGIVANESYNQRLADQGVIPIKTEEGLKMIELILCNPVSQVAAIKLSSETEKIVGIQKDEKLILLPDNDNSIFNEVIENVKKKQVSVGEFCSMRRGLEALNRFSEQFLCLTIQEMGAFCSTDEQYSMDSLFVKLNISEDYKRLYNVLIDILVRAGYIYFDGNMLSATELISHVPTMLEVEKKKELLLEEYPNLQAHIQLIYRCIGNYKDVLVGKQSYVEVLFPTGEKSLVENIYKGNHSADYYNSLVADTVKEFVEKRKEKGDKKPIKILEIGAGTGGTSRFVLECLKDINAEICYYYTDISLSFVQYGEGMFKEQYPFVEFKMLDIEKDILEQGFEMGSIDLIFGSNVFHATKNIFNTMKQVKLLLKKHGLIIINEMTYAEIFTSLTFGLTDGWWLYEDDDIRIKGSPLLSVKGWKNILGVLGFTNVIAMAFNDLKEEEFEQGIIVAESDGILIEVAKLKECYRSKESIALNEQVQKVEAWTKPVKGENSDFSMGLAREIVVDYVKRIFVEVLKLQYSSLDEDSTFEKIGIDSLIILEINKRFSKDLGKLASTLLFEYNTIALLVDYFIEEKNEPLKKLLVRNSPQKVEQFDFEPLQVKHKEILVKPQEEVKDIDIDIAIIGLVGRYPCSEDVEEFWEHLKDGDDLITEIPSERWNVEKYYKQGYFQEGKMYTTKGGFIKDADKFDPLFFQITPKEAEFMDPQERILLENTWSLFENAGITKKELTQKSARVGVFIGVMNNDYAQCGGKTAYWSMANRISYLMNFTGPSLAVDTACSSSLTSIHLACESIKRGECDIAVAGGVNLILSPEHYINLCRMNMLSTNGYCSAFSENADGFAAGEGVGTVLLKPLSKAIADKNQIYAVIKASSINNGGKTSGYTVPNPNLQASLIKEVLEKSKIDPRTIGYVEAHGTGTGLGDPIEIRGLQKAFGIKNEYGQYCAIGSVKSNIGHLESASGIASVTKVLLQLKHKMLVPSIHSELINSKIDFEETPFKVQHKYEEWKAITRMENEMEVTYPRRACISSFGAGGANAHVVIEEYEARETAKDDGREQLIMLSAKDSEQLREYARLLIDFITTHKDKMHLCDLAYTLLHGREEMEERIAFAASNLEMTIEKFTSYCNGDYSKVNCGNVKEKLNKKPLYEQLEKKVNEGMSLEIIGAFWCLGGKIEYIINKGMTISLPTYPFARDRYWVSGVENRDVKTVQGLHSLIDANISTFDGLRYRKKWTKDDSVIRDHVISDKNILPGAVCVEMVAAAMELVENHTGPLRFENIIWLNLLEVDEEGTDSILSLWKEEDDKKISYELTASEQVCVKGIAQFVEEPPVVPIIDLERIRQDCNIVIQKEECYNKFIEIGIHYGKSLTTVESIYCSKSASLAKLSLKKKDFQSRGYAISSEILDGALQMVLAYMINDNKQKPKVYVPYTADDIYILGAFEDNMYAYMTGMKQVSADTMMFDLKISDSSGNVKLILNHLYVKELSGVATVDDKIEALFQMLSEGVIDVIDMESLMGELYNEEKIK
jgi:acyl transferase domain-containing protein/NADP-dependent 3-hydroxy acid dehydrogenase YdfG/acyl carrier protein